MLLCYSKYSHIRLLLARTPTCSSTHLELQWIHEITSKDRLALAGTTVAFKASIGPLTVSSLQTRQIVRYKLRATTVYHDRISATRWQNDVYRRRWLAGRWA